MKDLKTVFSILPGPAVLFVTKWLNLFLYTPLVYPNWQKNAENISLAIGSFAAIALCLVYRNAPSKKLVQIGKYLLLATAVGIAICLGLWFILGRAFSNPIAQPLQDSWFICFVATMTLMVATISIGSLSIRDKRPSRFWPVVVVAALILVAGAFGYLLHR
jgi:hypothetical protein